MVMVNLWHPCRKIDVWCTKGQEEAEVAVNQGYIPLSHLRHMAKVYEVMKKRIEDQNNYITQLEHLTETGTERD